MALTKLPLELLELIIESTIESPDNSVALDSEEIKTLHSCLFLGRATLTFVQRILYSRCMRIDNVRKLSALVSSYDIEINGGLNISQKFHATTSMFLCPFDGDNLDDVPVIDALHRLFAKNQSIKRLVVDMPLRSLYADDPQGQMIRPRIREAFTQIHGLEELVSVQDELYMATYPLHSDDDEPTIGDSSVPRHQVSDEPQVSEPELWCKWPLKRLALYNVVPDADFQQSLDRCPQLPEIVILTRVDFGMVDEWEALLRHFATQSIRIVVVNNLLDMKKYLVDSHLVDSTYAQQRCEEGGLDFVLLEHLSGEPTARYDWIIHGGKQSRSSCYERTQDAVKNAALDGTLWTVHGSSIDEIMGMEPVV